MDNSRLQRVIKTLRDLAEKGVGGEASNAERLLNKLLKEHNITLADIDKPEKHLCIYNIARRHRTLFFQICWCVIENYDGRYISYKRRRNDIGVHLTYDEQLRITSMFDHYAADYDKQLHAFSSAYIHAQGLYPESSNESKEKRKMTQRQFDEAMRALKLSEGIEKNPYQDRIEQQLKALPE